MKKFSIFNHLANLFKIDFHNKKIDELEGLAGLDLLTQLPNRYLFQNMLANSLVFSQKSKTTLALLHLHVDNFKSINDSFGYKIGDIFLKKIIGRLRECLDEKTIITRLCSVEFCIILEKIESINAIIDVAHGIGENFKQPITYEEKEIIFSVNLGIAVSDGKNSVECMMRRANNALKQAKESRCGYKFYNKAMPEKLENYSMLARHLRNAIQENQFELYYQPKVNAESHMLVGIETLVRWNSPFLNNPSPADFIPVAEETGLINSLGAWIIKTALQQYDEWYNKTNKMQHVKISINLSPLQLSDNLFIETVVDTLKKTKIPTENILFEITETALMKKALDIKSLAQTFLMELGIGFAIDDFGTGYSSFTYLKELPVKELKIDKS